MGILEFRNDRFIADVASRLGDLPVEFVSFAAERAPVERAYRVLVDRLSFRYPFLREMLKSLALGGTYVINNPFAASATNKLMDMRLGKRLGLPFPKTTILPDRAATEETNGLVAPPNLSQVSEELGLPCILKPFDGYAWQDVYVVKSVEELHNLYFALSPRYILLAQQLIRFRDYYRTFCFDKRDVLFIRWVPKPLAMGQYLYSDLSGIKDTIDRLTEMTVQLNRALDLDVNVVEWCMDEQGQWWIIDAFNEVPEVVQEALPADYYWWIVDRFVACIRDKLDPCKKNRAPFDTPFSYP